MNPRLLATIRRLAPLLFAVAMGLAAVVVMRQYLLQEHGRLEREREQLLADFRSPVNVLVAAQDVPEGTTLEAQHLAADVVPEKFVQPYAARSPAELLGMVTTAPLAEGEQVLTNKVRRPDEVPQGITLSGIMPKGKRAVTIGVDAITGVGGFVRPGDAVDVLWTVKLPGTQEEIITLTLFQDVPVFAVGKDIKGRATETTEQSPQYTVTLALTPQETSFLLFAREQGRIQLSLRPQHESGAQAALTPATSATFNAFIESQLGLKAQAGVKPTRQVEVYKGLQREVVLLPAEGGAIVAE
jgi:pilus assembly protein CpaB